MTDFTKKELRKIYRRKLEGLPLLEKANAESAIVANCLCESRVKRAETFFCYRALAYEANTDKLIAALLERGKRVFLPRVCGDTMRLVEVFPNSKYVTGAYSILEPLGQVCAITPEVVFAPLYAFDFSLTRLGKGGGYYDKFFQTNDCYKIGLAFEIQRADTLPKETFDVALDAVVTEKGVYYAGDKR